MYEFGAYWDGEYLMTYKHLQTDTKLKKSIIKRAITGLKTLDLVEMTFAVNLDDGLLKGSGFMLLSKASPFITKEI